MPKVTVVYNCYISVSEKHCDSIMQCLLQKPNTQTGTNGLVLRFRLSNKMVFKALAHVVISMQLSNSSVEQKSSHLKKKKKNNSEVSVHRMVFHKAGLTYQPDMENIKYLIIFVSTCMTS